MLFKEFRKQTSFILQGLALTRLRCAYEIKETNDSGAHRAVWVYVWSLQCYSDAVEKYEDQHYMIKHFVGNHLLAHHSEPVDTVERDAWIGKRPPP